MIRKILEISSGPARLSIQNQQLVIRRDGQEPRSVPVEDIGILLIDQVAVSYTHAVFTSLAEQGATVVFCGRNHMPSSMLMPLVGNTAQTERFAAQLTAGAPLKKQLWRQVVARKLLLQAAVLRATSGNDAGLGSMGRSVRSGDSTNLEAQGARRYWPRLFGEPFRRDPEGEPPNNLLNYGYMAVRAAVARALIAAGLLPTVGIHHHNRYNAFCLADDLMEPYRPLVDFKVWQIVRQELVPPDLGREAKAHLLGLFNESVLIDGRRSPVLLAIHSSAASLARSFAERRAQVSMPATLPRDAAQKEIDGTPEAGRADTPDG
jgi:CRISPR-associated protein Cas1